MKWNSIFCASGVLLLAMSGVLAGCKERVAGGDAKLPAASEEVLTFVSAGEPQAILIFPEENGARIAEELRGFAAIVRKSTGVELPVVPEHEVETHDRTMARIYAGPTRKAEALGLRHQDLPTESYRIVRKGSEVFLLGADEESEFGDGVAKPTRWALNKWLEQGLSVRWLWPGELGTYVPEAKRFSVVVEDELYQPSLVIRVLRLNNTSRRPLASGDPVLDARLKREAREWAENHQTGRREEFKIGHAFARWWERYSANHPDYFAKIPTGYEAPFPMPRRVKLRLANPAVIDQIVEEYREAGMPDYWNVCPNDGGGFDISDETREWDIPANQKPMDIFASKGNLTARYVEFWNRLYERLRELNPEVSLVTYGYSCYRFPPPKERPLKAKAIIGIVSSDTGYEMWDGWSRGDTKLLLRPNWWHLGGDAPYLRLRKMTEFMKYAAQHGMIGLDIDAILGYWATQGANYYFAARLMTAPELSYEQLLDEYTEAFGGAKGKIAEYLDYWQNLTDEYDYYQAANYNSGLPATGAYVELIKEGKLNHYVLSGGKYALPYLYRDDVLAPARRLLGEALQATGPEEKEARARIRFLEKGLDSLVATREQVARGQMLKTARDKAVGDAFIRGADELDARREELTGDHAIWGETMKWHENRYKVLVRPGNMKAHNIMLDDI